MSLQLNGRIVAGAGVTVLALYIIRRRFLSRRSVNVKSPFASDSRLPPSDLITNKEERAKVLKQG